MSAGGHRPSTCTVAHPSDRPAPPALHPPDPPLNHSTYAAYLQWMSTEETTAGPIILHAAFGPPNTLAQKKTRAHTNTPPNQPTKPEAKRIEHMIEHRA